MSECPRGFNEHNQNICLFKQNYIPKECLKTNTFAPANTLDTNCITERHPDMTDKGVCIRYNLEVEIKYFRTLYLSLSLFIFYFPLFLSDMISTDTDRQTDRQRNIFL